MALTQVQSGMLNSDSQNYGFKNRIINGAMVIDQRNAGAAVTTNDSFPVDRFKLSFANSTGAFSAQQTTIAPAGFTNSIKYLTTTADASLGASEYATLYHVIEGLNVADLAWGTASAAPVTLSFWCRSSVTGTFGGSLRNSAGTRSYPFSYTISAVNTWEQKTITITGDTSGTWLTTNGVGIYINLGMGVGTNLSGTAGAWTSGNYIGATGAVNLIATLNADFYITGVQLEKGSAATQFDTRSFTTELQLCQRYFFRTASTAGYGFPCFDGYCAGGYFASNASLLPVQMRAAPTGTIGGSFGLSNCSSLSVVETDKNGFFMAAVTTGTGMVYWHPNSSGYVSFSAEL